MCASPGERHKASAFERQADSPGEKLNPESAAAIFRPVAAKLTFRRPSRYSGAAFSLTRARVTLCDCHCRSHRFRRAVAPACREPRVDVIRIVFDLRSDFQERRPLAQNAPVLERLRRDACIGRGLISGEEFPHSRLRPGGIAGVLEGNEGAKSGSLNWQMWRPN